MRNTSALCVIRRKKAGSESATDERKSISHRGKESMSKKVFLVGLSLMLLVSLIPLNVPAQNTVNIGAVLALTGVFGFAGRDNAIALDDAFTLANEEGGINGKRIKWIIEDGQYKLDFSVELFRRIMDREKPLVMFGESTAMSRTLAKDINERYQVLYSSSSFAGEMAQSQLNPLTYLPGPSYGDMFAILLKYIAKEKRDAKVAFFCSDSEFGKDPLRYGRLMCEKLRIQLVAEMIVPLGATDMTVYVDELQNHQPDFVIFQGFLVDPIPTVIQKCRERGMKTTFMGTFWAATRMILDRLGPLAEGYTVVNPYMYWWNDDVPMIRKIRDYSEKKYPDVKYRDNFYMQGFMNALIAVDCLRRADKAGELNGSGLTKALRTMVNFDSGGLCPPATMRNNRLPVGRVWKANVEKKIYEPVSDWIRLDRYSE
jgi:branched-chain amino acid transport system substrate-binding protein